MVFSTLIAGNRLLLPQRCTARWLYDAGLRTVEAIAQLPDEEELVHILSKPRAGADHGRCGTWRVVPCHVYSEDVCSERNIKPSSQPPKLRLASCRLCSGTLERSKPACCAQPRPFWTLLEAGRVPDTAV